MSIHTDLRYESCDNLCLDYLNPRLGSSCHTGEKTQDELLSIMRDWDLEELALSYLSGGGFWTQEALIVTKEEYQGSQSLIVVEGNRRLAALKYLKRASEDNWEGLGAKWKQHLEEFDIPEGLFDRVPYLFADSRQDVVSYLGFRHVSGIKQWDAEEKAGFITQLIDSTDQTFKDVSQKIGSTVPAVKKHYIAFKTLYQIERDVEFINESHTQRRFALLYMTLNTEGAKQYLGITELGNLEGKVTEDIVNEEHESKLRNFSFWIFGNDDQLPIVRDTRLVSQFGKILESDEAISYLEETKNPNFDLASRLAGGDQDELEGYLTEASHNIQLALMTAHQLKDNTTIQNTFSRLKRDFDQLNRVFEE